MAFTEEREFVLRFALEARFDQDDPPDDGYAWVAEWERAIKPRVVKAVFAALREEPGWEAHARSRGAPPEDELEIAVIRLPRGSAS